MNLNSETLDELNDTPLIDGDIVKPPGGENNPQAEKVLIDVNVDGEKDNTSIPQSEIDSLPEKNVSFNIVKDGIEKVVSLKAVEEEILAQEAISRSSAEYASVAFESIFDGPVKLSEFTLSPSKTNFDYVKKHMKKSIALEEASLLSNYQLLLAEPLTNAKEAYTRLLTSYMPTINSQLYDMRGLVGKLGEAIGNSKNNIIPNSDGTFVNLATTNLADINPMSIYDVPAAGNLVGLIRVLKCPVISGFIHAVIEAKPYPESIDLTYYPTYILGSTTAMELLKFYGESIDGYIEHLEKVCTMQFQYLNDLSEHVSKELAVPDNEKSITLASGMASIQDAFAVLDRAMYLMRQLSVLTFNAKGYLTYLSTL